jgi:hypothetical protein
MWLVVVLFLLFAHPVAAQPADCPATPSTGPVMPLAIDLTGRPGVPAGIGGQAYLNLPVGAPAGNDCHAAAPPPRDVLAGPPASDLLRGPEAEPEH